MKMAIPKDFVRMKIHPQATLYIKYIGHNIVGPWPAIKTIEVIDIAPQPGSLRANADYR